MAMKQSDAITKPEMYVLPPTKHVPNSPMPVLLYRDVLPRPHTAESATTFLEATGWERKGPVWGVVYRRHFHPNVHECYGIISGSSTLLLGLGKNDEEQTFDTNLDSNTAGLRITVSSGDVLIMPAGTGHSSVTEQGDYKYVSLFPTGAPHWQSENGTELIDSKVLRAQIMSLPLPDDPVYGTKGFLQDSWRVAKEKFNLEL